MYYAFSVRVLLDSIFKMSLILGTSLTKPEVNVKCMTQVQLQILKNLIYGIYITMCLKYFVKRAFSEKCFQAIYRKYLW